MLTICTQRIFVGHGFRQPRLRFGKNRMHTYLNVSAKYVTVLIHATVCGPRHQPNEPKWRGESVNRPNVSCLRALSVAVGVSLCPVLYAQGIEEIVVTAQKREEDLQDVPASIQ